MRSGDTMSGIAGRFGVSLYALEKANPQVTNPNVISVGQRLNIPGGGKTTGAGPSGPTAPVSQSVPGQVGKWIAQAQSILAAAGVPAEQDERGGHRDHHPARVGREPERARTTGTSTGRPVTRRTA